MCYTVILFIDSSIGMVPIPSLPYRGAVPPNDCELGYDNRRMTPVYLYIPVCILYTVYLCMYDGANLRAVSKY